MSEAVTAEKWTLHHPGGLEEGLWLSPEGPIHQEHKEQTGQVGSACADAKARVLKHCESQRAGVEGVGEGVGQGGGRRVTLLMALAYVLSVKLNRSEGMAREGSEITVAPAEYTRVWRGRG